MAWAFRSARRSRLAATAALSWRPLRVWRGRWKANGVDALRSRLSRRGRMLGILSKEDSMPVIRIGLDVAKNVFQAHGVDEHGTVVLRKQLRRREVLSFFASLPPCLIGIEACSASHHWARELTALGHQVRRMRARYVKRNVQRERTTPLMRLRSVRP